MDFDDLWRTPDANRQARAAALLERLQSGEPLDRAATALGFAPTDLIAALASVADNLGLIQAPPSRPWLAPALAEPAWARVLPDAPQPARLALTAGLLQMHDFWNESHEAAQQAGDLGERATSSYWHAIAHRREPDPGNAAYWFHRVGRHPIFPKLSERAASLIAAHGDPPAYRRTIERQTWDPSAFIDVCTEENRRPSPVAGLARELQRLELFLLLAETAAPLSGGRWTVDGGR